MVFTKLSTHEKDAFFGLLDEYFQSRPELFGQGAGQGVSVLAGKGISSTTAAASVFQRALAANSAAGSNEGGTAKSNNPYASATTTSNDGPGVDVAHVAALGRVAAASLAFSGGGLAGSAPSSSPQPPPPSLPRRGAYSTAPAEQAASPTPGTEVDKLVTRKTGVLSSFKKQAPPGVVSIPSAFVAPKNTFGPPPVRRTTSETSTTTTGGAPRSVQRQLAPEQEVGIETETEEGATGEWAEVLYDYSSEDPGDLAISTGARVWVTAKSSDDWWTGQLDGQGREGLFPASYVKLL